MDRPGPVEGREDAAETRAQQLADERIPKNGTTRQTTARTGIAHLPNHTRRARRVPLSFTWLMISDVILSPELVADDLRPILLRLARELRRETEQLGVTARQATLLWLVRRSPGLSLAELAAEEGISPPALSGHVDRLERAGLIERIRSNDDRRRVGLRLSDDGARLLRRVRARRTTWLAERLRALDPVELETIDAAIPALRELLGDAA